MLEKIKELKELQRMQEELEAEIESLKDAIRVQMISSGKETAVFGEYKVTFKSVTSTRIDSKKLAADFPDIYQAYGKTTESMRLTIA